MIEGSFLKALFFGVIAEDVIFPYPELSEPERQRVQTVIDLLGHFAAADLDPAAIDRDGVIPQATLRSAGEMGLMGLGIGVDHGGLGLSASAYARVLQEVASYDASLATLLYMHEGLGAAPLLAVGSEEQKARFLPRIASGELLTAFALAEAGSGSDPGSMRTQLIEADDGSFRLSGTKRWVTNADIASVFVVFARTRPADEGHKPRMVAALVEKGPGVEVGPRQDKLGLRGVGVCDVEFDGVRVPSENLLGERGKGYGVAMEALTGARVALSAALVGQCRAIVNESVASVQQRHSFGRRISEFPLIKDKITRMMADTYAVESMTYLTAGLADQGVEDYSLESAVCRVAGSEALWRVIGDAQQLSGGAGFMRGHSFERHLRNARGAFVLDGTNETLRCFIALSGMQGPGNKLTKVVAAMREPVKGFGLLREFAVKKVREKLRRERLSRAHPLLSREAVVFEDSVDELARAAERKLREHGDEIAEMQYVQLRISNMLIDLYALAATIARTTRAIQKHGEEGARRHIDLTTMFANAAEGRIRGHLAKLETNDDELRKAIASKTYTDNGYPFDVL